MNQSINQNRQKPFLTVETALWILVAIAALTLRLARLDAAPLNAREAHEATLAWRAATGQGMPGAEGYSPLLFSLNALLFALCGASDSLARWWPLLCGSLLALTPFLLRRRIGRVGALVAGAYLAFSPTLLNASRQLDGAVVAALGGMMFLGGLACFFDARGEANDRTWLALSAGGLGLAVTSSSSAFGLLLALGLTWLGMAWVWPNKEIQPLWRSFRPHLRYALAAFSLVGLAFSTALGWNLAGLGAVGNLLSDWFARFGPVLDGTVSPLTLLAVYELLALLFGLGGLVWAISRSHRFGIALGIWAGMGLLLLLLMPGRMELDVLWVLLPLTMLTGVATEQLARSLQERRDWISEGLHVPVVIFLWVRLYLALASYATSGTPGDLVLVMLTVIMQALLAITFALLLRFDAAMRSMAVGTGIVLLALLLSAGWGVAYVRPADPREPLVREPTAIEVRDLVQTLRDLSWQETKMPLTLPFTLQAAPDSVLAWYLRDFGAAHLVQDFSAEEIGSTLVSTQLDLGAVGGGAAYRGQDFTLRRDWDPAVLVCAWEWPLRCQSTAAWWLFRDSREVPGPEIDQQVVLWALQEND